MHAVPVEDETVSILPLGQCQLLKQFRCKFTGLLSEEQLWNTGALKECLLEILKILLKIGVFTISFSFPTIPVLVSSYARVLPSESRRFEQPYSCPKTCHTTLPLSPPTNASRVPGLSIKLQIQA